MSPFRLSDRMYLFLRWLFCSFVIFVVGLLFSDSNYVMRIEPTSTFLVFCRPARLMARICSFVGSSVRLLSLGRSFHNRLSVYRVHCTSAVVFISVII